MNIDKQRNTNAYTHLMDTLPSCPVSTFESVAGHPPLRSIASFRKQCLLCFQDVHIFPPIHVPGSPALRLLDHEHLCISPACAIYRLCLPIAYGPPPLPQGSSRVHMYSCLLLTHCSHRTRRQVQKHLLSLFKISDVNLSRFVCIYVLKHVKIFTNLNEFTSLILDQK
jgi:hypothetical protein